MKFLNKILIATDYSRSVYNAERYAVALAKKTGAELIFLHIYNPPIIPLQSSLPLNHIDKNFHEQKMRLLNQHLDEMSSALRIKQDNFQIISVTAQGTDPAKEILLTAKNLNPDLLIIGTHGKTGYKKNTFGSVTWKVIREAHNPVLVVPEDALFTGWNRMAYASANQRSEVAAISFLSSMAKKFNSEIKIVHITKAKQDYGIEQKLTGDFAKEILKQISWKKITQHAVAAEDIIKGLNKFILENEVDLLVLSPEKKNVFEKVFKESVRRRMSFHTRVPLLCLPDYSESENNGFWKLTGLTDKGILNDLFLA